MLRTGRSTKTDSIEKNSRFDADGFWIDRRYGHQDKSSRRFALCITNAKPDLEFRKVYQILPDESAARSKYVRIVDESGEDYLYPAKYFVPIEVPPKAERAILAALS